MNLRKVVAILGSARLNSNTAVALKEHSPFSEYDVIDLLPLHIHHYNYARNADFKDDFLPTIEKLLQYDSIIFATPVYWYAMSGHMKVFFDRLTDLISTNKALGRSLKGKQCYLIACGTDADLPEGFEEPFRKTCDYFDMEFVRSFYKSVKN